MLYIADLLTKRYPTIAQQLKQETHIIEIPNTQDIWLRDFMPITNTAKDHILFRYYPKYLRNPKYQHLISDNQQICQDLGLNYTYTNLILDGGSIVYNSDLYFISERIFADNPSFPPLFIRQELIKLVKTDNIIFLPEAPNDFTGHLDGVLAILNKDTLLINDYQEPYGDQLTQILKQHHFNIERLPYNPYKNKTYQSAKGIYINYIEQEHHILFPIFKQKEDDVAQHKLAELFPKKRIIPILCTDLAKEGGLLHCISWENHLNSPTIQIA